MIKWVLLVSKAIIPTRQNTKQAKKKKIMHTSLLDVQEQISAVLYSQTKYTMTTKKELHQVECMYPCNSIFPQA